MGSLFSGIGGLDLGLEADGHELAWCSELHPAASSTLERHWPGIPNHGDITKIDWHQVEPVDILCGGFPCQDISLAGKGAGIAEGTRSGLWAEYASAIGVLRPRYVFVENVAALPTRGLDRVLADLAALGFDAEWATLRASSFGAPHGRNRFFLVAANPDRIGREGRAGSGSESTGRGQPPNSDRAATDTDSLGQLQPEGGVEGIGRRTSDSGRETSPHSDDRTDLGERARSVVGPRSQAVAHADDGALRQQPEPNPGSSGQTVSRRSGEVAADSTSDGRNEGRTESTGLKGRPDVALSGSRDGRFGEYAPACERWERLTRPSPDPLENGRLSPDFVEWMMGFDAGWTAGHSKANRLLMLGNAVVPQVAAYAWRVLQSRFD